MLCHQPVTNVAFYIKVINLVAADVGYVQRCVFLALSMVSNLCFILNKSINKIVF